MSPINKRYSRPLRVFLCHSSNDKEYVRELYHQLKGEPMLEPWFDEENLVGGHDWEREIAKAVRNSDVVVICLSQRSITKQGFIQKEIKDALDIADEQPEDAIFLIPAKLEECEVPVRLRRRQWINLFEESGYEKLIKALRLRAGALELFYDEKSLNETRLNAGGPEDEGLQLTFAVPLAVVVSDDLTPLIDKDTPVGAQFREELPKLRESIYYELGVILPNASVSSDSSLGMNQYLIAINEVPAAHGFIKPDSVFTTVTAKQLERYGLVGEEAANPMGFGVGTWIPVSQREVAERAGLDCLEPTEVLLLHLRYMMVRFAHEFVGIQEASTYLEFAARFAPRLVEEVVPKVITIHQLTDVLRRLVAEGVSIRDIKSILNALSEWGQIERDTVLLTGYIRTAMKRYISFRFAGGQNLLNTILFSPETEDVIRAGIRYTSTGSFLTLEPSTTRQILDRLHHTLEPTAFTSDKPVIVTDFALRPFIRQLIMHEFPLLPVLCHEEIEPNTKTLIAGRITLE